MKVVNFFYILLKVRSLYYYVTMGMAVVRLFSESIDQPPIITLLHNEIWFSYVKLFVRKSDIMTSFTVPCRLLWPIFNKLCPVIMTDMILYTFGNVR